MTKINTFFVALGVFVLLLLFGGKVLTALSGIVLGMYLFTLLPANLKQKVSSDMESARNFKV